jgi:hypothetical protein
VGDATRLREKHLADQKKTLEITALFRRLQVRHVADLQAMHTSMTANRSTRPCELPTTGEVIFVPPLMATYEVLLSPRGN